uniref:Uncharacterized protein n=1 Tax=Helianthus annuus TaxID=4232 RepID=A0A251U752_HELAN
MQRIKVASTMINGVQRLQGKTERITSCLLSVLISMILVDIKVVFILTFVFKTRGCKDVYFTRGLFLCFFSCILKNL